MSDAAQRLAQHWGYDARPADVLPVVVAVAAGCLLTLGVAAAGWLVSPAYGVAFAIAGLGLVVLWVGSRGRAALRSARRVTVSPETRSRITALAEAVARDAGVPMPRLEVVEGLHPNALIAPGLRPAIAITENAATALGRTELESLLAHSLVRISGWRGVAAGASVALGPLAPASPESTIVCDVATVAVTRYPPALVSVLEKADDREGRFAAFWLRGRSRTQPRVAERIAGLSDL